MTTATKAVATILILALVSTGIAARPTRNTSSRRPTVVAVS